MLLILIYSIFVVIEDRGRGFGALAQTIGRTVIPFLWRYVVPAEEKVGADLLDTAAPKKLS